MSDDTVFMRGLGGAVFEMTLPLQPAIRKQYDAGDLVRVNADGSLHEDQALPGDENPEDDEAEDDEAEGAAGSEAEAPKRGRGKATAEGA